MQAQGTWNLEGKRREGLSCAATAYEERRRRSPRRAAALRMMRRL